MKKRSEILIICARNVIYQIPEEQDNLLVDYGEELSKALIAYLEQLKHELLELIYFNKFIFKMLFDESTKIFRFKFEYIHD